MTKARGDLDKYDQAAKAIRRAVPTLVTNVITRYQRELPEAGADVNGVTDSSLADHTVTLVAEIATILTGMRQVPVEGSVTDVEQQREMLLADGRTVYSVLGELHGRQRRRFKWTEKAICLEYSILLDELRKAASKGSLSGSEETEVVREIRRILFDARDHSLKTYRTPAKTRR